MRDSALPAVARALMQSENVRIYHDHLLVKDPGTRQQLRLGVLQVEGVG